MNKVLLICFALLPLICYSQETGSLTDTRDGKMYKTVIIGNQTWMAENMTFKRDTGCWIYENDQTNLLKYGYLYNWETAKNVCPSGWHLPNKAEFETLLNTGGNENTDSNALEQVENSGFCILLGGHRTIYGYFYFIGMYGYFWSSSQVDEEHAWRMYVSSDYPEVSLYYSPLSCGFSVRCIKDY